MSSQGNYAYTTLLGSDDYFAPVYALHTSLKMVDSKYPLVVMVMDTVGKDIIEKLEAFNIEYRVFPNMQLYAPYKRLKDDAASSLISYTDYFQIMMMNKFYMYELKEFDKVCYFDGDIVVRKNTDFVFNYNVPAGKILTYGDINQQFDEKTQKYSYVIDKPFVAGENIVINPKDYSFDYIMDKFGPFAFDEDIISTLYPRYQITNLPLTDWDDYIFHAHAHCVNCRYWEILSLYYESDIDLFCEEVIHDDVAMYQKLKHICGEMQDKDSYLLRHCEAEAHFDITKPNLFLSEEGQEIIKQLKEVRKTFNSKAYDELEKSKKN